MRPEAPRSATRCGRKKHAGFRGAALAGYGSRKSRRPHGGNRDGSGKPRLRYGVDTPGPGNESGPHGRKSGRRFRVDNSGPCRHKRLAGARSGKPRRPRRRTDSR